MGSSMCQWMEPSKGSTTQAVSFWGQRNGTRFGAYLWPLATQLSILVHVLLPLLTLRCNSRGHIQQQWVSKQNRNQLGLGSLTLCTAQAQCE